MSIPVTIKESGMTGILDMILNISRLARRLMPMGLVGDHHEAGKA